MSSIKLTADSNGGTFEIKAPASSSNTRVLTLPDAANGTVLTTTSPKAGNILQVKQTLKTDTFSSNTFGYTNITGLSVSITPSSSSSKILLIVHINAGTPSTERGGFRIFKDGTTAVGSGDAAGNRITGIGCIYMGSDATGSRHIGATVLDTPGDTNAHTYAVQVSTLANSNFVYINRTENDGNSYPFMRSSSSITALEVAA